MVQGLDDGGGQAHAGYAPGADPAAPLQILQRRRRLIDIDAPGRGELRAVFVAEGVDRVVLADVAVQEEDVDLGSGLIDHSQKMTVAAMQIADMKVWAHRS